MKTNERTIRIIAAWKKFQQTIAEIRKKRRAVLHTADETYSQQRIQELRKKLNNTPDNDHSR